MSLYDFMNSSAATQFLIKLISDKYIMNTGMCQKIKILRGKSIHFNISVSKSEACMLH